jgi:hypothetical protein
VFRWEVTFGDVLNAILIVLSGGATVAVWLWRAYHHRWRIRLRYPEQSPGSPNRTFAKTKTITVGRHEFFVWLLSKEEIRLGQLNVRCVSRSFTSWGLARKDAPRDIIEVLEVASVNGPTAFWVADGVGGIDVQFASEERWPAGKPLEYRIVLNTHKPWQGELSLCIERGEIERPYARAGLNVVVDPSTTRPSDTASGGAM